MTTTITRHDRAVLGAYLAGHDRTALQARHGATPTIRALAMCGGSRRIARHLVAVYDQLSARPVTELPPLGLRPGRVIDTTDQIAA